MSNNKIWLSSPHMGEHELEMVKEVFASNWIAPLGPAVNGFEQDLQDYNKIGHVAALSSGTAAIHLALIMCNVQPDDYVICQSLTFCGSSNPILYQKANPVLLDSELSTWNMDPNILEDVLAKKDRAGEVKKVKAIIPVHLYGMPAQMESICKVAAKYEIPIIEDAAEALGSTIDGKKCGSFGEFGIFSFNGNKIITTSGGGALASNNEAYIQKARFLSTQARDQAAHYEHTELGYNYRMSNVLAGIGRGQMKVLDERVSQKRAVHKFYEALFKDVDGITMLDEPNGSFSNRWLSTITVDSKKTGFTREDLRLFLEADNIESRPLWKPMHMQKLYADSQYFGGNNAEKLFENGLCLPSGSNLSDDDLNRISSKIKSFLIR